MTGSGKLSVYLCGSHSAGKTTLHKALQQDPEFIRFNFKDQEEIARAWVEQNGNTQNVKHENLLYQNDLRQPDCYFKLQKELLDLQILKENNEVADHEGKYSRFLWDRGVIDPIIYVKVFFGRNDAEKCLNIPGVKEALERWRIGEETLVFVPKPEREFNVVDGTRQESDHEEIMRIHNSMITTLKELCIPHKVINVLDLTERVQIVVDEVKRKWPELSI